MGRLWSRDTLTRRIDRCYLIAAGARNPDKRRLHLELARYYRSILSSLLASRQARSAEWAVPSLPDS